MSRPFGIVDHKVQEAENFLTFMQGEGRQFNFQRIQFCSSAFVAVSRSITFAMQASMKGINQFDSWYGTRQAALRNNSLASFFHKFRTVSQHIGETVVNSGYYGNEGTRYYFVPSPDLPDVPDEDVITACEAYFKLILQLVFDCYIDFGPAIDGQQRYTAEYFSTLGKGIEDAEEELGYPKGYTDRGDPDALPWRWETLRKEADGCLIEEQFERWLGKELPRLDHLPKYKTPTNGK